MAKITIMTATVAIGASHTTGVNLGDGGYQRFAIAFPTTNFLTAAADITAQASYDSGTTWKTISYSNSPATATSTLVPWGASRTSWGNTVICEAALFATDFRVKFGTAATSAGEVLVILGKED